MNFINRIKYHLLALATFAALSFISSPSAMSAPTSGGAYAIIGTSYVDYTMTSVTTSACTTVLASTGGAGTTGLSGVDIYDSSGQVLALRYSQDSGSTYTTVAYIYPGGNGFLNIGIPNKALVCLKAVSATANTGISVINFYR